MKLRRNKIYNNKSSGINPKRLIMKKLLKNADKKIGQSPGSLIYMGDITEREFKLKFFSYNKEDFLEEILSNPEEIKKYSDPNQKLWVNIDGIQHANLIGRIGEIFQINQLTLEDILNTSHRPKTEDLGDYIFIVFKLLGIEKTTKQMNVEHVSLILSEKFVLSFQEDEDDEFEIIRENLRKNKGHIREQGLDYLTYRILDFAIDNYFIVLENIGDRIEEIEDELLSKPSNDTLHQLYKLKGDMVTIRRVVWPLREAISVLEKTESPFLKKNITLYLRDLYDHIIQLIDTTENYREMISGMMDIYLSSISNKLNEVMKVLTIISTLFIPLTFIAGIYGMNFNTQVSPYNMPELNWLFGYPFVITIMLIVVLVLLFFFKKKKWF
jgi:magnesium transporter